MLDLNTKVETLSNGIRLVYLNSTSAVAHLGVTFLAGSRFENKDEIGLAHFLEHCIFKGTKNRKPLQILSRLDAVGGELNAFTTKEEICVYASFLKTHFNRAAELLADITIHSNFPENEIEKEKEIVLDELISYMDAPSEKIFDDFEAQLFKGNELGNNILGTEESIKSFSRKSLQAYFDRFFFAQNTVISFVGDLEFSKVKNVLEKYFSEMAQKKVFSPIYSDFEKPIENIRLAESNYQCHAMIGGEAPSHNKEERRAMTLLINLLGGPALNSRLILSVREKYGYSYNIEAQYSPFADCGYWSIYFGTDQKYVNKTLKVVHKELAKLRDKPLSERQLKQAKEQLKGHLALSLDSNLGLMQGLGKSLLLFNQIDSIEEIYLSIDKITSEELQNIALKYFAKNKISSLVFDLKNNN